MTQLTARSVFTRSVLPLVLALAAHAGPASAALRRVAVVPFRGPGGEDAQAIVVASMPGDCLAVPVDSEGRPRPVDARSAAALARDLGVAGMLEGRITNDGRWRLRVWTRNAATGALAGQASWSGARLRSLLRRLQHGARPAMQAMLAGAYPTPLPPPSPAAATPPVEPPPPHLTLAPPRVIAGPPDEPRPVRSPPPPARDEPRVAAAPAGPPPPPLWEISLGPRLLSRTFTYTDNAGRLPGYHMVGAPGVLVQGELYPTAGSLRTGVDVGIAGQFETSVAAKTVAADGTAHDTHVQVSWAGGRLRFPAGAFSFVAGADYGEHGFRVDVSDDAMAPNVRYTFVRPSFTVRAGAGAGWALALTAAYLHVLTVGGMNDAARFPHVTAQGAEVDASIGYALDPDFELRLVADLRHYAQAMHVAPTDRYQVGGALDEHFGGALLITYHLR